MALLLIFALLAGAGTALTPCVLPVLPALLSASATGGRRRPAGIVIGLVVCHTLAVVALATVIDGVGLASGTVRTGAVIVLGLFGAALIWPRLGDALERPLYRLARFGPKDSGRGFWSGLAVGGALGFVYAPCAGPILAAVVAAGATGGTTGRIVAVAVAYGIGSGVVLFALAVGGRKLFERVKAVGRGPGAPARPGRGPGPDRGGHGHPAGRALPDRPGRPPAPLRGQPHRWPRALGRRPHAPGRPARAGEVRPRHGPVASRAGRHADIVALPRPGAGARLPGRGAVAEHAAAVGARPAPRAGRAGRLLDLHLHQLHPHPALPALLGPALPAPRPHRGRGTHPRVPVRAQDGQRARRHRPEPAPLPGGAGQRLRHLERVRQPVLAGQVPDRRPRARALHPLRRGRLRRHRDRHPRPAGRGRRRPAGSARRPRRGHQAREGRADARDLLRRQARPGVVGRRRRRAPAPTGTPAGRRSTRSRSAGAGGSRASRPPPCATPP